MDAVWQQVLTTIAVAVVMWVGGRFSIKTKPQEGLEKLEKRVAKIEEALPIILKCHLAQLIAQKDGKTNGECEEALEELKNYLFKK